MSMFLTNVFIYIGIQLKPNGFDTIKEMVKAVLSMVYHLNKAFFKFTRMFPQIRLYLREPNDSAAEYALDDLKKKSFPGIFGSLSEAFPETPKSYFEILEKTLLSSLREAKLVSKIKMQAEGLESKF